MKIFKIFLISFSLFFISCSNDDNAEKDTTEDELYFPPIDSSEWETTSIESLNWNDPQPLYNFLENSGTKAFIILKNGRIVIEWYGNDASPNTRLPWYSAGKTLSAFLMGVAQQENYLSLDDSSQKFLGEHWSSLSPEQEKNISVWNHLTMTTGLDYNVENTFCTDPECLTYLNDPGEFWYYYNAPYTLTQNIIASATGQIFMDYFNDKLGDQIGMFGAWLKIGYNHIYFSYARSAARFGLLCLNKGVWEENRLLNAEYFDQMVNTSQDLNKSYGLLWWLNGKSEFRLPQSTSRFNGAIIPNAPSDLIAGLGMNDQKLYVVPSEKLVIIRLGESAGESTFSVNSYDHRLWEQINAVIF